MVLTLLRDLGEQPHSERRQALCIDGAVVALLNGLEDEGLIECRRCFEDRRKHIVLITKAGRRRPPNKESPPGEQRGTYSIRAYSSKRVTGRGAARRNGDIITAGYCRAHGRGRGGRNWTVCRAMLS
ncbi:hypothetical protein [Mycobacterium simiae]|uniref:hypothetical protein n=1 Tax=Mycobacterium simiae TaxID=1784 RepID=UPI000677B11F|nr:hypothetical protein [Mycobacterium simiae]PLV48670.1 hypothetical protein X011_16840 [Mycobacterium tuberculosis variant microti OV254]